MTWNKISAIVLPAIALALGASGDARADLVTNGDFAVSSFGGGNQVDFYGNVSGWSGGDSIVNSNGIPVLTFVDQAGAAGSASNVTSLNPGFSGLSLSGSSLLSSTAPNSGNFVVMDGDPNPVVQQVPISQTINGLVAGQQYVVSFYQAAAQQLNFGAAPNGLTSQWVVTFGSQTQDSALMSYVQQGSVAWESQSLTFTASGTSALLSFLAVGTPYGEPPFSLLDGVSVNEVITPTPEPSTLALTVMGLFSLGVIGLRRRRARIARA